MAKKDDDDDNVGESNKEEENKPMIEKVFGSSAVIGLPQIATSRSVTRKILWCTVLIVGLTFCAIESRKFMIEFHKYPVVVNLEIENKGELEFPAVTLCNLNIVKKSEYNKIISGNNTDYSLTDIISTESASSENMTFQPLKEEVIPYTCNLDKNLREKERTKFYSKYFFLNKTIRATIGHQKKKFIFVPSFNSIPISKESFETVMKPRYGACYIFNSRFNFSSDVVMARNIGDKSGFATILNLEVNEYLNFMETVGARIVIHSPDEYPDTEGEGINIPPGMETSISIKKQSIRRLAYPYKDKCKDYKAEAYSNNGPLILNQKDCRIFCLQNANFKECGCTDPNLVFTSKRKCDVRDRDKVCCLNFVFQQMIKGGYKECNCPIDCFTTTYQPTISMSKWPAPEVFRKIKLGSYSEFRGNFTTLVIYYSSLEETIYVQRPAYENSEWYSQLGGQLGLWLGISLPAIFDCIESIIFLIYHVCFPDKNKKKFKERRNYFGKVLI